MPIIHDNGNNGGSLRTLQTKARGSYAVECTGLTRAFSARQPAAVSDVSFALKHGEILSLVGASGCGKTTTLRLVAGFEIPDGGTIEIEGKEVARSGRGAPANDRPTGLVFQEHALFPHLTVRRNVEFGLKGWKKSERERRVDELLDVVSLSDLGDRYPHQLSGGQAQRVALIRALAPKPRVILLDEPFNNLDVGLRFRLLGDVERLIRAEKTSAIMVTHDWQEAFAISDRIAVMNEGRILQIGTPREVYEYPRSRFVAEFFGPLNELPAGGSNGAPAAGPGSGKRDAAKPNAFTDNTNGELLCIRPRDVVIATGNEGAYPNCLTYRAIVTKRRFLGEYQEIHCRLINGGFNGAGENGAYENDTSSTDSKDTGAPGVSVSTRGDWITAYAPANVPLGEGDRIVAACPKEWLLRFTA